MVVLIVLIGYTVRINGTTGNAVQNQASTNVYCPTSIPNTLCSNETTCNDGIDNNNNGQTDCADVACTQGPYLMNIGDSIRFRPAFIKIKIESITKEDTIVNIEGVGKAIKPDEQMFFPNAGFNAQVTDLNIALAPTGMRNAYYPVSSWGFLSVGANNCLSKQVLRRLPEKYSAYTIKTTSEDLYNSIPSNPAMGGGGGMQQTGIMIEAVNPYNTIDTGIRIGTKETSKLFIYASPKNGEIEVWGKNTRTNVFRKINMNSKRLSTSTILINLKQLDKEAQNDANVYDPILLTYNHKNIPLYIIWTQKGKKGIIAMEYQQNKFFNIYIEAVNLQNQNQIPGSGSPTFTGYAFTYLGHTYGPDNSTEYDISANKKDVSHMEEEIKLTNTVTIEQYNYNTTTQKGTAQNDEVRIRVL